LIYNHVIRVKETLAPEGAPAAIRQQLQRILGHSLFSAARRQSQFLQFVVERTLEGNASEIKESLIGVEVYGRDPSYDPKSDSIVRAEASRLRAKLREYYETDGRNDPLRIELRKGSYMPSFRLDADEPAAEPSKPAAPPVPPRSHSWWPAPAAAALILAVGVLLWGVLRNPRITGGRAGHSIAVMPPANLGPDRLNDSLGDTLAEELTGALVDSADWKVVGRAPSVDQTGRDQMLTWLQQNLHAEFVLLGGYKVGENSLVRLSLQLVDLADGSLVWTQTYAKRLTFLAETQQEFVRAVVSEITAKTHTRSSGPGSPVPTNEDARRYTRRRVNCGASISIGNWNSA
jgi:TolB-like protein